MSNTHKTQSFSLKPDPQREENDKKKTLVSNYAFFRAFGK